MREIGTVLTMLVVLVVAAATPVAGAPVAADAAVGASDAGVQAASAADNETTLTVLSYNDIQTAAAEDGNLPRLATLIERRRGAHANPTVLAGGGDQLSPHALSPVSQWRAPVDVLNELDPAAEVVGNHDLDYGFEAVPNYTAESEFPWLAANLVNESTGEPIDGAEGTAVVERGGVRVGFVGLVDRAIIGKTGLDFDAAGVEVRDFRDVGPAAAQRLREEENVDVVVAVAHIGVPESRELAQASDDIDVVVTGDDERYFPPREVSGTVVTEAGARAAYLGELNLTVNTETDEVTAWNGRIINVTDDVPKDDTVSSIINDYRSEVSLDSPIGTTTTPLDARFATNYHRESRYGNLITDAMRAETGADVAITNAGGIRSNRIYGPGQITGGDVFNTLPFANTVVTVELTGAELRETLASQVVTLDSPVGRQFGEEISQQVSGVSFEWVPHEGVDRRIRDVYVNGEPLDPDATYEVAVNSFIAGGGSGYPLADEPRVEETDKLLATTVIEYVEARGTVSPEIEGRMDRVDRTVGEASVTLTGHGQETVVFHPPENVTAVNASSFYAENSTGARVSATDVAYTGDSLRVRFADAALERIADGNDLNVYGSYTDATYSERFVYFEDARLNGDLTVRRPPAADGEDGSGAGEGRDDGNGNGNGTPASVGPAPVATTAP